MAKKGRRRQWIKTVSQSTDTLLDTTKSKECRCGGLNENCCWCGGSGMVSPNAFKPRSTAGPICTKKAVAGVPVRPPVLVNTRTAASNNVPNGPSFMAIAIANRVEKARIKAACEELSKHNNAVREGSHRKAPPKTTDTIAKLKANLTKVRSKSTQLFKCSECCLMFPGTLMPKHLKDTHAFKERLDSDNRARSKSQRTNLVACCECEAMVRADRMNKHLKKCHAALIQGIRPENHLKIATRAVGKLDDAFRGTFEDGRHSRKMDAGKDNYHIRENGRFGSSPSYDNFGDESDPD